MLVNNPKTPILLLANKSKTFVSNLREKLQAELTSYSKMSGKKEVNMMNDNVEVMHGEVSEKNERGEVTLAEETIVGVEQWIMLH